MPIIRYDRRFQEPLRLLLTQMRDEAQPDASVDMALAFANKGGNFCALQLLPEGPVGFIIAQAGCMPWDVRPKIYEQLLFVRQEYRGTSAAGRLVAAMEQWAIEYGIANKFAEIEVQMQQRTGIDPERTRRFFEHAGYEVIGYSTRKRLCVTPATSEE